jgi:hypothetical protein
MIKKSLRSKYSGTLTLLGYLGCYIVLLFGITISLQGTDQENQTTIVVMAFIPTLTMFIVILLWLFKGESKL